MAKPYVHACSSARKLGGKPEDYLPIHELMDSSKAVFPSSLHRCLTHQSWFIGFILPRIFGETAVNSDGRVYSVRDVGEQHVLEDYNGFIPTPQDFLQEMEMQPWMNNGVGVPPSMARIVKRKKVRLAD